MHYSFIRCRKKSSFSTCTKHHAARWHLRGVEMQKKKRKKEKQHQREEVGWIWVIFDLWSDYSLSFLLKTPLYLLRVTCAARPTSFRSAPKQKKGSARFAHGASGNSFVQATQSFTCTNTHLGGDKMENSSFSRLNRPLPPQLGNHSVPFTS